MTETQPIGLIYQKIPEIMSCLGAIPKDGKNEQQGWNYRKIETILARVHPLFGQHGVFIEEQVLELIRETAQSRKGEPLQWSIAKVRFRFFAKDGSFIEVITFGESMDSSDKSVGKAQTYAMKVALTSLLAIPVEVSDPDEHVPDYVREARGGTTLKAFNELKRAWLAGQGDVTGKTKSQLSVEFASWAAEMTGSIDIREAGDWKQWKQSDVDRCLESLTKENDNANRANCREGL